MRSKVHAVMMALAGAVLILCVNLRTGGPKQSDFAAIDPDSRQMQRRVLQAYAKLPLSFEVNEGQSDPRVKFVSRGAGYGLFLTSSEVVLCLHKSGDTDRETSEGIILTIQLAGANPDAHLEAADELPVRSNYFIGNDRAKWRAGVVSYAKVKYEQIYPGIDLVFYGNQRQLEYDFVVAPGADPRRISLSLEGASATRVEADGDLVLEIGGGEVRLHRPTVYQESDSAMGRRLIDARYAARSGHQVGIELAAYDHGRALIIDPLLSYSTYLGGSDSDDAKGVAVDASGNAYVAGATSSINFPVQGGYQTLFHNMQDAFVTKLNPNATFPLLYSTFLGGANRSVAYGIAVDGAGNAYVVGETRATNFPTKNAYQTQLRGQRDAFVAKIDTNRQGDASLVYSTFVGGVNDDLGRGIAADEAGNAYFTGLTYSRDFPTKHAFQETFAGARDAFVARIDTTRIGSDSLVYSSYLGGGRVDEGHGIAADGAGNAYVVGFTNSIEVPDIEDPFPTTLDAFQTNFAGGVSDAFISKIDTTREGSDSLIYSTLLGGSGEDKGYGIAIDADGNAYVTGFTASSAFPTTATAFQVGPQGGGDAFVTKLNSTGSALIYSTYFGGTATVQNSGRDEGNGIALDPSAQKGVSGVVWVTGLTRSYTFPVRGAFQDRYGCQSTCAGSPLMADAFIAELDTTKAGSDSLLFSSYHGGIGDDIGQGVAVDGSGNAYFAGVTTDSSPPSFPTTSGVFQRTYGGAIDAFVAKVRPGIAPAVRLEPDTLNFGNQAIDSSSGARTVTLTNSGNAPLHVAQISLTGTDPTHFQLTAGASMPCSFGVSTLAPGARCTLNVVFHPTTLGPKSAAVEVTSDAVSSPDLVSLTGTGVPRADPIVTLVPSSLDFGVQTVGTSSTPRLITLSNSGTANLNITSITLAGTDSGQFTLTAGASMPCSFGASTLVPGAHCTLNVTFHPTTVGPKSGNVKVDSNAPSSPDLVPLTGIGRLGPAASLDPPNFSFGEQTVESTSDGRTATLTNTGDADLAISSVALTGANRDDFLQTTTCESTVAAGESCEITVRFKPTALGNRTASVSIVDNAPGSPQQLPLSGTGVSSAGPALTLSATRLTFVPRMIGASSEPMIIDVTSSGHGPVTINRIAVLGAQGGEFGMNHNCPPRLLEGASCRIDVRFTPGEIGQRIAAVSIDSDASGNPLTIDLRGTGSDFSLRARDGASTTVTVKAGEAVTYNLEVVPSGGFIGAVELACGGAPMGTACAVSPGSVSITGSAPVPFSVSLLRSGSAQVLLWPGENRPRLAGLQSIAFMLMGGVFSFAAIALKRRARRPLASLAMALAVAVLGMGTSCGSSGAREEISMTVTGTFQNGSRPLTLTLVVRH